MRGVKISIRRVFAAVALFVVLLLVLLWFSGSGKRAAADRAAAIFHQRYDEGLYDQIYADASFTAVSREAFATFLSQIKTTAGKCGATVRTRQIIHYRPTSQTVDMQFSRRCENADLGEASLWQWAGGRWRLIQLNIVPVVR